MAARHSKQAGLVPAVAYLRMSDKKQDKSIPAQKDEIEKYAAAKGYRVIRWYRDDGISGAETVKRAGFQALILDAQQNRDFEVIIVWDQDRFSRFDPMEANYYWYILRQAGVRIVTVATGELDFNDLGGWLYEEPSPREGDPGVPAAQAPGNAPIAQKRGALDRGSPPAGQAGTARGDRHCRPPKAPRRPRPGTGRSGTGAQADAGRSL